MNLIIGRCVQSD